jgi:ankyrin repeat protein
MEKNNNGSNALHFLCQLNSSYQLIDAIRILIIVGGIKVNEKDKDGRNALHLLCAHNSSDGLIDAIKVLTTFGIQVASNGFNARIILQGNYVKENRDEILEFLDRAFLKST